MKKLLLHEKQEISGSGPGRKPFLKIGNAGFFAISAGLGMIGTIITNSCDLAINDILSKKGYNTSPYGWSKTNVRIGSTMNRSAVSF